MAQRGWQDRGSAPFPWPRSGASGPDGGADDASGEVAPPEERPGGAALGGALLVLLVLAAYGKALGAGWIWDDADYLTANRLVHSLDGLRRIWLTTETPQYYPLVFTVFWIGEKLWGMEPLGYHLVNVLVHGASAVLVWRILRGLAVPGAWLAAAVFALHPVQVESVAWVTELKNVLSGLFYLLALGRYLSFHTEGRERDYALALAFFVAALLSKSVTATLPAAILIVLWWRDGAIRRSAVLRLLPFFALGAISASFTAWLEVHRVGAQGAAWDLGILERLLLAARIPWFYLSKLLWPAALTFSYPRWRIDAGDPLAWLGLMGLVGVSIVLWRTRARWGRGPAAAAAFFVVTLVPVLGFLNVYPMRYSYVADHFQYLAALGPITLASATAAVAWSRRGWSVRAGRTLAGIVLVLLGGLTLMQTRMYRDEETLWRATLDRNPRSWMAHNNLGMLLADQGNIEEAIQEFGEALRDRPDHPGALANLGGALLNQGRISEAEAALRKALTLEPASSAVRNNLAQVLLADGRTGEAIEVLETLRRIDGSYAPGVASLGAALLQDRRPAEAAAHLARALDLDPDLAEARFNLALVLGAQSRHPEMITLLREGLRRRPDDGALQQLLAWELATAPEAHLRNGSEALRLARHVLAVDSEDPILLYTLAAALAETGDFRGALTAAERAEARARAAGLAGEAETIRAAIARLQRGEPLHSGRR